MMGFESLSALYRPTSLASGKNDRAWLQAEIAYMQSEASRQMPKRGLYRFGILRRAAARFVALLF
ncbi:MAG: hypothetical protein R6W91_01295 [Thermoplasmata archaeon]